MTEGEENADMNLSPLKSHPKADVHLEQRIDSVEVSGAFWPEDQWQWDQAAGGICLQHTQHTQHTHKPSYPLQQNASQALLFNMWTENSLLFKVKLTVSLDYYFCSFKMICNRLKARPVSLLRRLNLWAIAPPLLSRLPLLTSSLQPFHGHHYREWHLSVNISQSFQM